MRWSELPGTGFSILRNTEFRNRAAELLMQNVPG